MLSVTDLQLKPLQHQWKSTLIFSINGCQTPASLFPAAHLSVRQCRRDHDVLFFLWILCWYAAVWVSVGESLEQQMEKVFMKWICADRLRGAALFKGKHRIECQIQSSPPYCKQPIRSPCALCKMESSSSNYLMHSQHFRPQNCRFIVKPHFFMSIISPDEPASSFQPLEFQTR